MPPLSRRAMLYGSAAFLGGGTLAHTALAQRSPNGQGNLANAYPAPPPRGAVAQDTEWRHYANGLDANRYSPLDQIGAANFNNLQVAWRFDSTHFGPRIETNWESTPLLVKGRLYVTAGARRDVICLDAVTGELIWMHREDEGARARTAPRILSGRGCSYWTDGKVERIVYVTSGYRLISLDIATGTPDPRFGRNGSVDLRLDDDQQMDLEQADIGLQATPLVANNVIVVGAAHTAAANAAAAPTGNVRGYDARTGRRLWIFHTIPRKGEFGYDSWAVEGQGALTGHAGVWGQMCADEKLGLVYFGVELPVGDALGMHRKGAGLFGESLVALDLKTGRRKWHFQMVHHGLWDSDVPCSAMLMDLTVDGKAIKAIAQPSKQGCLYVFDRETGEPVWPIPEAPQAPGDVPDEWYAPTQPIPSKPPAYDRQNIGDDDLIDFTPALKARAREIASHYVHGGGLYQAPTMSVYEGTWGTLALPGLQGGTNWPGGAFDPETGIAYVYSKTQPTVYGVMKTDAPFGYTMGFAAVPGETPGGRGGRGGGRGRGGDETGGGIPGGTDLNGPLRPGQITVAGLPIVKPPYGRISALDLKNGSMAWQVAHGETPDNIRNHPLLRGLSIPRTGQVGIVGPLVTKTLVICGDPLNTTDAQGKSQSWLRAYDKATGREVGAVPMTQGQTGTPMTYAIGGWQYIVLCIAPTPPGGSEMIALRLRQV